MQSRMAWYSATLGTMLIALLGRSTGSVHAYPDAEFLPGAKRVMFVGDSITYDGRYVSIFECEWLLHDKKRKIEIIDTGLPSETVSGLSEDGHAGGKFPRPTLHERLDRMLPRVKADVIFACYGMNDGIYLPLEDERFQAFKDGMIKLHKKAEAAGASIIHLTPPVFDPVPIPKRVVPADKVGAGVFFADYNKVLDRYSDWLLSMRKPDMPKKGWQVIDLHHPMQQAIDKAREKNPKFTFAPDGVHPNLEGHLLMAKTLMAGLHAPFDLSAQDMKAYMNPKSERGQLFKLVHQRRRLMTDAWITDIRHKRPIRPGLPLDEARKKAAQLDRQISALLN